MRHITGYVQVEQHDHGQEIMGPEGRLEQTDFLVYASKDDPRLQGSLGVHHADIHVTTHVGDVPKLPRDAQYLLLPPGTRTELVGPAPLGRQRVFERLSSNTGRMFTDIPSVLSAALEYEEDQEECPSLVAMTLTPVV